MESERLRGRGSERRRLGWLLHLPNTREGQLHAHARALRRAKKPRRQREIERERGKGDVNGTVAISPFQNLPNYFQIYLETSKTLNIKVAQNLKLYNFHFGTIINFSLILKLGFQVFNLNSKLGFSQNIIYSKHWYFLFVTNCLSNIPPIVPLQGISFTPIHEIKV
jgi:hypothetical protein